MDNRADTKNAGTVARTGATRGTSPEGKPAANARPGKGRRIAFYGFGVVYLLLLAFQSPLLLVVLGWFLEEPGIQAHRVHEISFGAFFALSLVGLLVQFRRPESKIAPAYQMVLPITVGIVAVLVVEQIDPFVLVFFVLPMGIVALHPAGRRLWRPSIHPSVAMLVMAGVLFAPLAFFSVSELRVGLAAKDVFPRIENTVDEDASVKEFERAVARETSNPEEQLAAEHYGHWSVMAAFAVTICLLAVVAGLRPKGWRITAWSAGAAAAYFGAASIAFPFNASSVGRIGGTLLIIWGVSFVALAWRESEPAPAPSLSGEPAPRRVSGRRE